MSAEDEQIEKMAEIAGLATAIADRIFEQQEIGAPIHPEHFRMFIRAAQILLDKELPWPPAVERLILEFAKRVEDIKPTSCGDNVVQLTRPQGVP
ncbi:hypothetical protein ACRBEV_05825 [Methylobacterium phyllosphaerae]